ncbi:hypothetical protein C4901_02755 [Acidiferrobacter sp. SPIII_3]|nr:hypothetical protein C4901_02755 [Acidiferrobacter sp. SPIII_3]
MAGRPLFWESFSQKGESEANACGGGTPRGPCLLVLGALQTQHRQDLIGLGRQAPERRFDVRDVEQAQEADSEVPQAGEGPGRVPLAGPATILVIGALMFATWNRRRRLIVKFRRQARVRGVCPLRARQRSSS